MDIKTTSLPFGSAPLYRTLPPRPRRSPMLARLLAPWLDARLARGGAPGSGRLLAARAADLVGHVQRRALADAWDALLVRAAQPGSPVDPRVPLAHEDIRAASGEIAELAAALRAPSMVDARDVARARILLTDGTGPLYDRDSDLRLQVALLVAALAPLPPTDQS